MKTKKKIVINICFDLFIRNYIINNSFEKLEKKYDCYFIASGDTVLLKNKIRKKKNFLGFYKFTELERKRANLYFLIHCFKQKNNSRAMNFNLKVMLKPKFKYDNEKIFNIALMFFPRILSNIVKRIKLFTFSLLNLEIDYLDKNSKGRKFLKKTIDEINPNLIISPIQGWHIGHNEINKIAKKKNIKTLSIIDNWDNCSSKPMLKPFYDNYLVWGKQSLNHAHKIHKINKKNIHLIGTSRFSNYYKLRSKKLNSHFDFKYILYIESWGIGYFSLHKDDQAALEILDQMLENKKNEYKNTKIIYRPYPWRFTREIIDISKFKNVILDPQIKQNYLKRNIDTSFQPDLNYYPSLLKNAEIVIAGPTTMVIESALFNKKTIMMSQNSNRFVSNGNFVENSEHFDEIEKIKLITICKNLDNLSNIIERKINNEKLENFSSLDKKINYFLYNDKKEFKKRLLDKISKII